MSRGIYIYIHTYTYICVHFFLGVAFVFFPLNAEFSLKIHLNKMLAVEALKELAGRLEEVEPKGKPVGFFEKHHHFSAA